MKMEIMDKDIELRFTSIAYSKMCYLLGCSDTEVGWNGVTEKVSDELYIIKDILVYPQEVTGATIRSDDAKFGLWEQSLPDDIFYNLRMFAHSHVNFSPEPSQLDVEVQKDKYKDLVVDNDFYIFLIVNKKFHYTARILVKDGDTAKVTYTKHIMINCDFGENDDLVSFRNEYVDMVKQKVKPVKKVEEKKK